MSEQKSSADKYGKLVFWLKPIEERNYDNLVESFDGGITGDYITKNENTICQKQNGEPIDFSGVPNFEMYEWLIKETISHVTGYEDVDVFKENSDTKLTNIKSVDFPNYNIYLTTITNVRRDNEEINQAIERAEIAANDSLVANGIGVKINALKGKVLENVAKGMTLTPVEQSVYDLDEQIAKKVLLNAERTEILKALIMAGGTPDIKAGWEFTIANTTYPFN